MKILIRYTLSLSLSLSLSLYIYIYIYISHSTFWFCVKLPLDVQYKICFLKKPIENDCCKSYVWVGYRSNNISGWLHIAASVVDTKPVWSVFGKHWSPLKLPSESPAGRSPHNKIKHKPLDLSSFHFYGLDGPTMLFNHQTSSILWWNSFF